MFFIYCCAFVFAGGNIKRIIMSKWNKEELENMLEDVVNELNL